MVKRRQKNPILKEVEKLLGQQTNVILSAVDNKIQKLEKGMDRLDDSMNELKNTLDKFLKRLTDFDDEFKIVKARVNKIEKILQEKLGVTID
ncbi:hypothetical protein KJ853_04330 [Patescibacteria group bacterium]|nr:hypothetical protein [Patescibacteria group bacterium]